MDKMRQNIRYLGMTSTACTVFAAIVTVGYLIGKYRYSYPLDYSIVVAATALAFMGLVANLATRILNEMDQRISWLELGSARPTSKLQS
jgi:cytochrome c biogenesis protein CcdA